MTATAKVRLSTIDKHLLSFRSAKTKEESDLIFAKLSSIFDKDIKYLIKTKIFNYGTSDMCYDYDDVYSECLGHLWNATKIFKLDTNMKFRTFAIMHLKSRIGNLRNKVQRRNLNGTVSMTELDNGWGITGREESYSENSSNPTVSSHYKGFVVDLSHGQDALNEILDAKTVLNRLSGHRKTLFSEYYIKGKKIKEICEDNLDLKYYQVRRHMKYLDQIYKTLIKGETPCLQ